MAGTFSGFNTALSALRYNRVVMDVASSNVANAQTPGYTRRRVEAESVGAPVQPAMWSRYDGAGDGVRVSGLGRMSDAWLDMRARAEHGSQSYLDVRRTVLARVEAGIGEPGENGVAAALADFRQGWHDLANNPGSAAARSQLLTRAGTLVETVANQARSIETEAADQRVRLQAMVTEVNTLASDLAVTNRSIAAAKLNGTDAGTLLDQRDLLAMRLAELAGAKGTVNPDGGVDVTLNGVPLVTGSAAGRLAISSGVTATGGSDGAQVAFSVAGSGGTTAVPAGLRGEAGAVTDLLNTTLPAYLSGLDEVARTLADEVNAQHVQGYDAAGSAGGPLFAFDPARPASSLALAVTDPAQLAASGLPGGVLDAGNADALGDLKSADGLYQRLVNGFGVEVASANRLAANQQVLTDQVDGAREQLSGVSLDEEMLSMVTAQRAYEAASKVMSVLDSVLDTLINRTGLTR